MTLYGVRVRSVRNAEFDWFTTDEPVQPGRYGSSGGHGKEQAVVLAESIPGLLLEVGPLLQQAEDHGREALASPGISEEERRKIEDRLTAGLVEQLTETSAIWQPNPSWVRHLEKR